MSATVKVDIRQLPHGEGLALPAYQSADAAGLDLLAAVPADTPLILPPGKYAMVPTALTIALPSGYEAQVRPRSGLAAKHGVTVLNSPGTVDADYRGEINVLLINHGEAPFPIRRGERIAQMVIAPVVQAELVPVDIAVGDRPRQRRFRLDRALTKLHQKCGIGPQGPPTPVPAVLFSQAVLRSRSGLLPVNSRRGYSQPDSSTAGVSAGPAVVRFWGK